MSRLHDTGVAPRQSEAAPPGMPLPPWQVSLFLNAVSPLCLYASPSFGTLKAEAVLLCSVYKTHMYIGGPSREAAGG